MTTAEYLETPRDCASDLAVEVLSPHPGQANSKNASGGSRSTAIGSAGFVDLRSRHVSVLRLGSHGVDERIPLTGGAPIRSSVLPGLPLTPAVLSGS